MPVTAGDFLRAFQRLMEPENFNSYAAIIKNAEDIYQGKKKIEELGVTVLDEKTLHIATTFFTFHTSLLFLISLTKVIIYDNFIADDFLRNTCIFQEN